MLYRLSCFAIPRLFFVWSGFHYITVHGTYCPIISNSKTCLFKDILRLMVQLQTFTFLMETGILRAFHCAILFDALAFGLGLGLGLEVVASTSASVSTVRPRPRPRSTLGCLASASISASSCWPRLRS